MSYRFVGVIGHDHCGSTAYCRLLASLPGVATAGELHWLVDAPPDREVATRAGWSVSRRCTLHGDDCPVFTPEFRGNVNPRTLYHQVRRQMGADTLVSTDKYPGHFERFMKPRAMLGVVLFKHPRAAVTSDVLTNRRVFDVALDLWAADYRLILEWAPRYCARVIWQRYEDFATDPTAALEAVAGELGVRTPPPPHRKLPDCCIIGGNEPARGRGTVGPPDARWRDHLSDEQLSAIDNHAGAQQVLHDLEEQLQ